MEYLSTGEQFEGTAETLVDLYVGESVFERMLLFVIEKGVPHTHTRYPRMSAMGGNGGGEVLILAHFSSTTDGLGSGYEFLASFLIERSINKDCYLRPHRV